MSADGSTAAISGDLGRVTGDATDAELNAALASLGPMFQVSPGQLRLERVKEDEFGNRHFRFAQIQGDQDVVGGDLMVHVDAKGSIYSVTGTTRNVVAKNVGKAQANLAEGVRQTQALPDYQGASVRANRTAYVIGNDNLVHLAYQSTAEGVRGQDPFVDEVFTDVDTGALIAVHPRIHFAKSWDIYNTSNTTSLPGSKRVKVNGVLQAGQTTDATINQADTNHSFVYDTYLASFNRDSYNAAGANIRGTVHYSSNYVNAFWNSTQMVYGDGDGTQSTALTVLDVVGHELTHAVTENESNLTYSGESGGMNESMSDVFGAFIEYKRDGVVSANTWKVGEECWTPGTPGDALRYMNDPALDGGSKDFWVSGVGNVDVHYSSGIGNLTFYLLSQGGTHPRGKSTQVVTGIGIEKAAQIFYRANANYLTASSNYAAFRTAALQAATDLYGASSAEVTQTGNAFTAVGILGSAPPPPPGGGTLENGVPKTNQGASTGTNTFYTIVVPAGKKLVISISGGSGDADLYTKFGSAPTTSSYDCRPYLGGNSETCTVASSSAGTYHVMLRAYSTYSGVTLTATYTDVTSTDLPNGGTVSNLSGATNSFVFWKTVAVPAGKTVKVTTSGGTGDADLYVRKGAAPTTSTYDCRPYTSGNAETCNVTTGTATSTVVHIGIRGYAAYSGVTLNVTW